MRTFSMLKVPAVLVAAVLAVASWATVAQAQNLEFALEANVPFAFESASGQHFAPGKYTMRMHGADMMVIQGTSSIGMVLIQMVPDKDQVARGKAVFTRYGDKYFLRTVWGAGYSGHLLCQQSKAERQLQIPANRTTTVELALLPTGR